MLVTTLPNSFRPFLASFLSYSSPWPSVSLLASTELARATLFGHLTVVLKLSTATFSCRLTQATSPVASVNGYFTYSHLSLPASWFLSSRFIMKLPQELNQNIPQKPRNKENPLNSFAPCDPV